MASLLATARDWVDQIHVNAGARAEREGRPVWVKRRRWMAGLVMRLANGFFRLAQNPVEALVTTAEWRAWEVDCFRRLHGPHFAAGCDEDGAPWVEMLPGECLSAHLEAGTLTAAMLGAAAAELRRCHALDCSHHQAGWSHGDPHTGNFLYDPATGRARLIDFEVRHRRSVPEPERQADDLLVLLQDVCGRCAGDAWPDLVRAVLTGYDRPEVAARLRGRLKVPRGVPRLWWAIRTTWMRRAELERRLAVIETMSRSERPEPLPV